MDAYIRTYLTSCTAIDDFFDPDRARANVAAEAVTPAGQQVAKPADRMRDMVADLRNTNVALKARLSALRREAQQRQVTTRMVDAALGGVCLRETDAALDSDAADDPWPAVRKLLMATPFGDAVEIATLSPVQLRAAALAASWHRGLEQVALGDTLHLASVHGVARDVNDDGTAAQAGTVDAAVQTSSSAIALLRATQALTRGVVERSPEDVAAAHATMRTRPGDLYHPRRHSDTIGDLIFGGGAVTMAATLVRAVDDPRTDSRVRVSLTRDSITFQHTQNDRADGAPLCLSLANVTDCILGFGHAEFAEVVAQRLQAAPRGQQRFPPYTNAAFAALDAVLQSSATQPNTGGWKIPTSDGALLAACSDMALSLCCFTVEAPIDRDAVHDAAMWTVTAFLYHLVFESVQRRDEFVYCLDQWAQFARPRRVGMATIAEAAEGATFPVSDQIAFASPQHERLSLQAAQRLSEEELAFCATHRIEAHNMLAIKKRMFGQFSRSIISINDIIASADVSLYDCFSVLRFYQQCGWLRLHSVFRSAAAAAASVSRGSV